MAATPEIAVVIPTRGREPRLAFALESLAGQIESRRLEVVVVRDADAPDDGALAPPGLPLRELRLDRVAGPSAKRNLGWRSTRAPLVAFTDDDCRVAPGWLEALLAAANGPATFVQGRTEPDPQERHLLHGLARSVSVPGPTGWFETCNIAYPRELLEALGGFDETLDFGGEDTDLGWRALGAGAEPRFARDALVWHAVVSRSVARAFSDAVRWPDTAAVIARHRELRRSLHRGFFWNREHMTLALALAGLPAARRFPALALLAAVPYAGMRINWREPRPRRVLRGLATLPLFAAVDAVELASRLPSAIKHRVVVI